MQKKTSAGFKSSVVFNKVEKHLKSNNDATAEEVAEKFKISKSRAVNILHVLRKRMKESEDLSSSKYASDIFADATRESFLRSSYR